MSDKNTPKMRIKLKGYDIRILENAVSKVIGLLTKSWAKIKGPIPLPKKRKVYTVLRANFVYKDSREQFERVTYSRLIDVVEVWDKTIEQLQNISIPVWVSVEVKIY